MATKRYFPAQQHAFEGSADVVCGPCARAALAAGEPESEPVTLTGDDPESCDRCGRTWQECDRDDVAKHAR